MVPQHTPLYLVTSGSIDGEPIVVNELVVGWTPGNIASCGYEPMTVTIGRVLEDTTAGVNVTQEVWAADSAYADYSFGTQRYSTTPLTTDDLDMCDHDSLGESDATICPGCGLHIDLAQAHSRLNRS